MSIIEANKFDACRHAIQGTGTAGNSYEARYNRIISTTHHSFDMHGGWDRYDGTDIAGNKILIHHNTFEDTDVSAVMIRGTPVGNASIHHNWFLHSGTGDVVIQAFTDEPDNFNVFMNLYTSNRELFGIK